MRGSFQILSLTLTLSQREREKCKREFFMKFKKIILVFCLLACVGTVRLFAEEQSMPDVQPPAAETISRLRRLREENPEEF